jgi:hypothetical protein
MVLLAPALLGLVTGVRRHYDRVARTIALAPRGELLAAVLLVRGDRGTVIVNASWYLDW